MRGQPANDPLSGGPPRAPMVHPYSPSALHLPNYDPDNQLSQVHALLYMGIPMSLFTFTIWHLTGRRRSISQEQVRLGSSQAPPDPHPTQSGKADRILTCWFLISGLLHLIFEGAFVLHAPSFTLHSSPSTLAQLWREYAKSDSRYLLKPGTPGFSFVWAIEIVTVFVTGPLAVMVGLAGLGVWPWRMGLRAGGSSDANIRGYRLVMQVIVSTAHLWGVALYYLTAALPEAEDYLGQGWCRKEAMYFWGYMVAMNLPWVFVPAWVLIRVGREVGWVLGEYERLRLSKGLVSEGNEEGKKRE